MGNLKRDENGRFVKGTVPPKSPGRPKRATEQDYLEATIAEVTIDDWRAVVRRALADAKKGNGYARQWLAEYLIGKPPQILDIRAADAKLLAQAIEALRMAGLEPSEVFQRMIDKAQARALTKGMQDERA